jgi:hypothetical protein
MKLMTTTAALLPSPLLGGVGGGGRKRNDLELPTSLTLPRKGGGNRDAVLAC